MEAGKIELLTGSDLHKKVILDGVLNARKYVWIATANLKDMHVSTVRGYRSILQVFDRMAAAGVAFRIAHSDLPSGPFRNTLSRFPRLTGGALELQICPRAHWKMVIVDGECVYFGSANFTGAGLGARIEHKRNLELGVFTTDPSWVERLQTLYDTFWMGAHCPDCRLRQRCPEPISDQ
jgi:phosphatidylserine/phosphatidylglycerophosphate/cardiolipin synthase-like enzyme